MPFFDHSSDPEVPQSVGWASLGGLVLLVAIVGLVALSRIEAIHRQKVERNLRSVHESAIVSLQNWTQSWLSNAQVWAEDPQLIAAAQELLQVPGNPRALIEAPAQATLRGRMLRVMELKSLWGYFIIAPDGTNLASSRDVNIGVPNLLLEQEGLLERVFQGETLLSRPQTSDVPLPGPSGVLQEGMPTQFVVTAIRGAEEQVIGTLTFRLDPAAAVGRILDTARPGTTGETYAFDDRGRLLTRTRFRERLVAGGLLAPDEPSILHIEIRDPGVNVLEGQVPATERSDWPLTQLAAAAIRGESGMNLDARRSYHGAPVVAIWTWIAEDGFGLATEQSFDEAYEDLRNIRYQVGFSVGLTAVLCLGFAAYQARARHLALDLARQIHENERQFQTLVEQAAEAVILTDPKGVIEYVNPAFEALTGYSRREAIGQNPNILKSGKQDQAFYEEMWSVITQGGTWRSHIVNRRKDGELYDQNAVISPLFGATKEIVGYIGLLDDITQQIEAEKALRRSEAELRQAQKMEAIGKLAGGVAHDFNNLLAVILGHAEIAVENLDPDNSVVEEILGIIKASERGTALTQQLLAFSRKEPVAPTVLPLNSVVTGVRLMLSRLIGENIQLHIETDPRVGCVLADPSQLERVLVNMVTNSRDAMPEGGEILIQTGPYDLDESYVKDAFEVPAGRYFMLAVTDSGTGMDNETLSRVFDPFFTTKGRGEGTGLGMSTIFGIVKQCKGYVWGYSEPGRGTVFKVFLPAATDEGIASSIQIERPTDLRGNETVFVVEDDEMIRSLVRAGLGRLGYKVILVSDLPEAMLRLQRLDRSKIDLLLADMVLPGGSGADLARRFQAMHPEAIALVTSGYPKKRARGTGEDDLTDLAFLQKPFTITVLATKIRELLGHRHGTNAGPVPA